MDVKVNTALVTVKTVPLTKSVVKQLDFTYEVFKEDEFIGRFSGFVLEAGRTDTAILIKRGSECMVTFSHVVPSEIVKALPKIVIL